MDFLHQILGDDLQASGLIIFNLILFESLLSIDNAAVLATMVIDLPKEQRSKALKYGIFGAYFFRGLCLFFAAYLFKPDFEYSKINFNLKGCVIFLYFFSLTPFLFFLIT